MPQREYLPDGCPLMTPRERELARLAARLERAVWSPYPREGMRANMILRRVRARLAPFGREMFKYEMQKVGLQP